MFMCIYNYYYECDREATEFGNIRAITAFKVIQGHRFWYQSKANIQLCISN